MPHLLLPFTQRPFAHCKSKRGISTTSYVSALYFIIFIPLAFREIKINIKFVHGCFSYA